MKTVGKQLQEAREGKNWTPELAARETKIKVSRVRDLEADDYTQFSSPAYARGFVRTYARALGLDEYKILRQLDNKLPEDDNASFATDSGLPYIPEPSKPMRGGNSGSKTGLYVAMTLGCGVLLVITFILFQAYRAGELKRYFAHASETNPATTNVAPNNAAVESPPRALPVNPNTPPPPVTPAAAPAAKAVPVDNGPSVAAATNSDVPATPPRALPVDPSELTNAPSSTPAGTAANAPTASADNVDTTNAPRALPVDPSELTGTTNAPTPPPATPAAAPVSPVIGRDSARASGSAAPTPLPAPTATPATTAATSTPSPAPSASISGKRLVLTASRDSFVRVTAIDAPDLEQVRYHDVLHAGQSIGYDDRKFSINIGVPAAVNISLDGVNYGPHSDKETPETFTVESHQP